MTPCSENIGQVMGQYLNFASLENNLFSLLLPQSFVQLNGSTDADAEAIVEQIVTGLFSALVTLGVVPVLRYPRGGAAQMVAELLGRRSGWQSGGRIDGMPLQGLAPRAAGATASPWSPTGLPRSAWLPLAASLGDVKPPI